MQGSHLCIRVRKKIRQHNDGFLRDGRLPRNDAVNGASAKCRTGLRRPSLQQRRDGGNNRKVSFPFGNDDPIGWNLPFVVSNPSVRSRQGE